MQSISDILCTLLRWYGAFVNFNIDKSTLYSKIFSPVKNFQILQYFSKNYFFENLWKGENCKSPAGFELMTYFVANPHSWP